jgi:hypothetical protein
MLINKIVGITKTINKTVLFHTEYTNLEYIVFMIIENKNDNENIINSIDFLMNFMNESSIQKL